MGLKLFAHPAPSAQGWSSAVHWISFVGALLFAFLPVYLITWILLLVVGIASLGFVIQRLSSAGFGAGVFMLVGAVVGVPLSLFLAAYVLPFILAGLYPTLLNFWAAWLLSRNAKSLLLRAVVFLAVAIPLGLSYRLLPVAEDILHINGREQMEIDRVIQLGRDDTIAVDVSDEQIIWRNNPVATLSVGGNEGCMCAYWELPKESKENLGEELLNAGLRFKKETVGKVRLEMQQHTNSGVTTVRLAAWDGDQQTARYEFPLRQGYGPELELLSGNRQSLDSAAYRFFYFSSANVWNGIAGVLVPKISEHPVRRFLEQAFKPFADPKKLGADSRNVVAEMIDSSFPQVVYSDDDFRKRFSRVFEACDGKAYLGNNGLKFVTGNEEYVVRVGLDSEYVRCTDTDVYVLSSQLDYPRQIAYSGTDHDFR